MPRFQFNLRTLLIVVTLLAIPLGWLGWQAKIVRDRDNVFEAVSPNEGDVWWCTLEDDRLSWYRKLLGDHFVTEISYYGAKELSAEDWQRVRDAYPEAVVKKMAGF